MKTSTLPGPGESGVPWLVVSPMRAANGIVSPPSWREIQNRRISHKATEAQRLRQGLKDGLKKLSSILLSVPVCLCGNSETSPQLIFTIDPLIVSIEPDLTVIAASAFISTCCDFNVS